MSEIPRLRPRPAPPRYPVLRPRRIERSDRCINCGTCVSACLYGCHEREEQDPRLLAPPKEACCRQCFACVMKCPRNALSMHHNEAYQAQGRGSYNSDLIRVTLEEAAEGKIPVSGSGYGGSFDGDHYDNIWTDMSEIVRPTRDGIHGREDISTRVSLGRSISDLRGMQFDEQGQLKSHIPPAREIALPVLFGQLPFSPGGAVQTSLALAATRLTTYATVPAAEEPERFREYFNHLIVRLTPAELAAHRDTLRWASIVELDDGHDAPAALAEARSINPHLLTSVRVPVGPQAPEDVAKLVDQGAEIIHLAADCDGHGAQGQHLLDCLRACHLALVERGTRDLITLLASGGIVAAEHVPKAILLGADAVVADLPLLVAMECTLCRDCAEGQPCSRGLDEVDPRWGATRLINLMLAWRDQLLEVLGAMGLRDVRRLRGEIGRAIFADHARQEFCARLPQPPAASAAAEKHDEPTPPLPPVEQPGASPCRFATPLGPTRVRVDRQRCIHCGLCVTTCPYGVHRRPDGRLALDEPLHAYCIGEACLEQEWCCVSVCPEEALSLEPDSTRFVLGDKRWTADLLLSTYRQARSGEPSVSPVEHGASAGGFDRLALAGGPEPKLDPESVELTLPLNRRGEGPELSIPLPMYGGGMSYGSISLQVMRGRAMAAQVLGGFTSTGEGGYPDALVPYADHVITQIATGLFGVREQTIQRARLVEFKYAQGAKPGLGGHLLGEKNTQVVAQMRQAVPGTSLFSPFPFHSVYSVEDHKKHLDWIRAVNPDVLLSVKVSTPGDVDMVAVGSFYAGANIVHLDGSYGGTGAAPDIAKKNIAQPIEYAAAQTHDFLVAEGIRDQVTLIVSGGVRSPADVLKAVALGADGVVLGTAELVAIDCVRCGNCERNRGCPIGIATTDPELAPQLTSEWVRDRIVNLYRSWAATLRRELARLGLPRLSDLRGRRELLRWLPASGQENPHAP